MDEEVNLFGVRPIAWGSPSRAGKLPDTAVVNRCDAGERPRLQPEQAARFPGTPEGKLSQGSPHWNPATPPQSVGLRAAALQEPGATAWDDCGVISSIAAVGSDDDGSIGPPPAEEPPSTDTSFAVNANSLQGTATSEGSDGGPGLLTWSEGDQLFWCDTGLEMDDIPDGKVWQQEFREKLEEAKPQASRRTRRALKVCLSEAESPFNNDNSAPQRSLARNPSDPEKRSSRAAHNTALQQMSRHAGVETRIRGHCVALFRYEERLFAVAARCPHQGGSLVQGEVGDIEDMVDGWHSYVACPVHKFRFDLRTGAVLEGSCSRLQTYPTRIREGAGADEGYKIEVGFTQLPNDFFCMDDELSE